MTAHTCTTFDPNCFRCDLSRDELHDLATPTPERVTLTDAEMHRLDIAWDCGSDAIAAIEQILTDRRAAWEAEVRAQVNAGVLATLEAHRMYVSSEGDDWHEPREETLYCSCVDGPLRGWVHTAEDETPPDWDALMREHLAARIAGGDQ